MGLLHGLVLFLFPLVLAAQTPTGRALVATTLSGTLATGAPRQLFTNQDGTVSLALAYGTRRRFPVPAVPSFVEGDNLVSLYGPSTILKIL